MNGGRIINDPNGVLYLVGRSKIINRVSVPFPLVQKAVNPLYISISQEYVSGLCPRCFNMINAVFFLFRPGELVLFNYIIVIIINGTRTDQPGLTTAIHHQLVHIVTRFAFPEKYVTLNKSVKVL